MNRIGLVLSAVLVGALVALAPAVSHGITAEVAAPATSSLGQYMPKDATVVIAVNVADLSKSGVFETLEETFGADVFKDFEAMEIDVKKDIQEIMFGITVNPEDMDADPGAYVAVSGNLPTEKRFLELYKEEEGETPESRTVKGKTVYNVEGVDMCFLPGVILFVPVEETDADITNMLGGPTGSMLGNTELAKLMKAVDTKATVWAVASLSQELRDAIAETEEVEDEDTALRMSALQTLAASFKYGDKVELKSDIGFANEDAASELVEAFNTQVKPLGEQLEEMMPEAAALIKALGIKSSGSKATITLSMDRQEFDDAVQAVVGMVFGAMMGGMEDMDWEDGTDE